jgi:hypothetical protein
MPALTFGKNWEKLKNHTATLINSGAKDFLVSNLGHINLCTSVKPGLKIWGDHRLGILNHQAGNALLNLGLTGICLSAEIDEETYNRLALVKMEGRLLIYLYGRPALFSSRFKPTGLKRGPIISPKKERFWSAEEGDAFILHAENKILMSGIFKNAPPVNLIGLIVDLRREPKQADAARNLKKAILKRQSSFGSSFNFKRGLI